MLEFVADAARAAGLGITIHVGEEGEETGVEEIGEVVEHLRPQRIGHGILAARDPALMRLLADAGVVLEICPTSNLLTKALGEMSPVVFPPGTQTLSAQARIRGLRYTPTPSANPISAPTSNATRTTARCSSDSSSNRS